MGVFDLIRAVFGLDSSKTTQRTDVSAGSGSDDGSTGTEPTTAEPAEAGAGVTEHSGTETPAAESAEATGPVPDEPEAETGSEAAPEGAADDAENDSSAGDTADDPVDSINGIGQAYAGRLAEADIETVGELLEADAAELAGRTDLSEKRIRRWQENADGE